MVCVFRGIHPCEAAPATLAQKKNSHCSAIPERSEFFNGDHRPLRRSPRPKLHAAAWCRLPTSKQAVLLKTALLTKKGLLPQALKAYGTNPFLVPAASQATGTRLRSTISSGDARRRLVRRRALPPLHATKYAENGGREIMVTCTISFYEAYCAKELHTPLHCGARLLRWHGT